MKNEIKINDPRISIMINADRVTIEVEDNDASTRFIDITLTPENFVKALSRMAMTECKVSVRGLDRIGKKHENRYFEFEIPEGLTTYNARQNPVDLLTLCKQRLEEAQMSEWEPDTQFSNQNSFFNNEGKHYARAVIRRWITQ